MQYFIQVVNARKLVISPGVSRPTSFLYEGIEKDAVVNNGFFAESHQAKRHPRDVTFYGVEKTGHGLVWEVPRSERECLAR